MKRLLAYLFIVFGLGLTYSVNANSVKYSYDKDFVCFQIINGTTFVGSSSSGWATETDSIENICSIFVYKDHHPKEYSQITEYWPYLLKREFTSLNKHGKTPVHDLFISSLKLNKKKFKIVKHQKKLIGEKTQIAKTEPSQMQKVAADVELPKKTQKWTIENISDLEKAVHNQNESESILFNLYKKYKFTTNDLYYAPRDYVKFERPKGRALLYQSILLAVDKKDDDGIVIDSFYLKKAFERDGLENAFVFELSRLLKKVKNPVRNYEVFYNQNIEPKKIQIASKQPKFKPLREALEEKYGDPKSEETKVTAKPKKKFKPKETISDDESPIIDIASVITVNDQVYTLKGKIKDESGVYLTVDGRAVDLNNDEFEIERFSVNPDQQQKIKIVAIDDWNNKSEKTVTVKIDLSQNKVAKKYEDLKPNNIRRVKTDNNKIAIIIGIEKYQYLNNFDAKYANRDANAFRAYATRALGIPSSNVEMLVDDKATRTQILKTFKNNLRRLAGKKGKDIHIFFAGHGLASDNGEDLYILPQDGESSLLEDTAISRVELIELIQQVNPNSVTMYFDTCYSGQTRDEQLLVASLRPVRIVADEQETPDNFTIFTASDYDQTSGSIEEVKYGMFSYYLMKGLEGNADLNTDNKITNGELISYLKDNVSQEAFIQNRQQDPMFSGDPDKVLVSF